MAHIIGIDYSMSSPAICVYDTRHNYFCFENTKSHFIAQTKHTELYSDPYLKGYTLPLVNSPEARYNVLAQWAMKVICQNEANVHIFMEGYSFSSSGLVFNIAENTAILKHKLYMLDLTYTVVPPTTIKKMASGKGTSNKEQMYEAFMKETNLKPDLKERLSPKSKKISSPVSDIVDAFYICKYAFNTVSEEGLI
jgi:Holliday junction resolvasome RuvABC endonuclease subunit